MGLYKRWRPSFLSICDEIEEDGVIVDKGDDGKELHCR